MATKVYKPFNYNSLYKSYETNYKNNVAQQEAAMLNQLNASKASTNANYNSAAAGNYLNYAKQQNALGEQLAARGINGGASETAMVNMNNNYALGASQNEASRNAAIGQLQSAYDTNIANIRNEMAQALSNKQLELKQKQAEWKDTLNQRKLNQYQATIERFTSTKSIDKALKKLKKSDPNYTAKKQLLLLRKSQLKQNGGGGGGGGRRSGGGRSYGGGNNNSSGSTATVRYETPIGPQKTKTTKKKTSTKTVRRHGGRSNSSTNWWKRYTR